MKLRNYLRQLRKAANKRKFKKAAFLNRTEKLLVAKLVWGFGLKMEDKYYYHVVLILIATGMHLKDLLNLTIEEAEKSEFKIRYPLVDNVSISWLKKQSEKNNCSYLLHIRHRKSYQYYFNKIMRKSCPPNGKKRIIPGLKGIMHRN